MLIFVAKRDQMSTIDDSFAFKSCLSVVSDFGRFQRGPKQYQSCYVACSSIRCMTTDCCHKLSVGLFVSKYEFCKGHSLIIGSCWR